MRCFHPLIARTDGDAAHAEPRRRSSSCATCRKRFVKPLDLAARIAQRARRRHAARRSCTPSIDVDLAVARGEVVGPGRRIGLRQVDARPHRRRPAAADRGRALLEGRAARRARAGARRAPQQLKMQMIFQDPYASLNPRMRVVDIVGEAPVVHGMIAPQAAGRVRRPACSNRVGLDPTLMRRYPAPVLRRPARAHRHRARAGGASPSSWSATNRSRRSTCRSRRRCSTCSCELRGALNLTYLFISHDLGVVAASSPTASSSCTSAASSRAAPTDELFARPTIRTRRRCSPRSASVEPRKRTFVPIKGEIPSPLDPPPGCHFHPRCPHAMPCAASRCRRSTSIAPGHRSACWLNVAEATRPAVGKRRNGRCVV